MRKCTMGLKHVPLSIFGVGSGGVTWNMGEECSIFEITQSTEKMQRKYINIPINNIRWTSAYGNSMKLSVKKIKCFRKVDQSLDELMKKYLFFELLLYFIFQIK